MKKLIYLFTITLICTLFPATSKSQTTPNFFYGENAWLPDSNRHVNTGGYLHKNWNLVAQSNVKFIRYGGALANDSMPTRFQYLKMVDSIRKKGMEPILQVAFRPGLYDSSSAVQILTYINKTKGRKVKYWIIGNEPDYKYNYKTAVQISSYIIRISSAMKHADTSIRIIGPSLSRLSVDVNDTLYKVIDTLTSATLNNSIMGNIGSNHGAATGFPLIDYFSYHVYDYDDTSPQSRSWLISRITTAGKDTARMGWLKRRLNSVNVALNRASRPVKPVITEANICTQGNGNPPAMDAYSGGLGCSGFFAGQHWCELMSYGINKGIEWINFWSTMEKNGQGYTTNSLSPTKKSTYYHMEQMGKWFVGTHKLAKIDSSGVAKSTIKAFASVTGAYVAVMVINQDSPGAPAYRLYNLSLDSTSNGTNLHIKINAPVQVNIDDTTYASSTNLIIFDCSGHLVSKYRYKLSDSLSPGFKLENVNNFV